MAYQSFFSGSSGATTASKPSGGYQSFFGTHVQQDPSASDLAAKRQTEADQAKQQQQSKQAQQVQQQKQAQANSLRGRVKSLAGSVNSLAGSVYTGVKDSAINLGKSSVDIGKGAAGSITGNKVAVANANKAKEKDESAFLQPIYRPLVEGAEEVAHPLSKYSYTPNQNSRNERIILGETPIQNINAGVASNYDAHANLAPAARVGLAGLYGVGQAGQIIASVLGVGGVLGDLGKGAKAVKVATGHDAVVNDALKAAKAKALLTHAKASNNADTLAKTAITESKTQHIPVLNTAQSKAGTTLLGKASVTGAKTKNIAVTGGDKAQAIGVRTPIRPGIKQISETSQVGVRTPQNLTDAEYTKRFNAISKSYEDSYKALENEPPVRQKILAESIDRQHQAMIDQLNTDQEKGILTPKTTVKTIARETSPAGKTRGGLPKLGKNPRSEAAQRTVQGTQSAIQRLQGEKGKLVRLKAQNPGQPAIDDTMKNLDAKITELQKTSDKAQQDIETGATKDAEQTAKETEQSTAESKKIDQQIELINAKKADNEGKLSNVDTVKLRHLTERKQELSGEATPQPTKIPIQSAPSAPKPRAEPSKSVTQPTEGNVKTSGVAKSIEAKAIEKKLTTGFGDLAEFKGRNVKDQSEKIAKLITEKPDDMVAIVNGQKALPEGLSGSMFIKGVEEHALQNGDTDLLRKLAQSPMTSETSLHASELRLLGEREPDSALANIKELAAARRKAFEGKTKGSVDKAITATSKEIKASVKKPSKMSWGQFAESLKC